MVSSLGSFSLVAQPPVSVSLRFSYQSFPKLVSKSTPELKSASFFYRPRGGASSEAPGKSFCRLSRCEAPCEDGTSHAPRPHRATIGAFLPDPVYCNLHYRPLVIPRPSSALQSLSPGGIVIPFSWLLAIGGKDLLPLLPCSGVLTTLNFLKNFSTESITALKLPQVIDRELPSPGKRPCL